MLAISGFSAAAISRVWRSMFGPSLDTFMNISDVSGDSFFVAKLISTNMAMILNALVIFSYMSQSADITLEIDSTNPTLERLLSHMFDYMRWKKNFRFFCC
jgi:hypothetical protein